MTKVLLGTMCYATSRRSSHVFLLQPAEYQGEWCKALSIWIVIVQCQVSWLATGTYQMRVASSRENFPI